MLEMQVIDFKRFVEINVGNVGNKPKSNIPTTTLEGGRMEVLLDRGRYLIKMVDI